jgi:hypothetical protein
MLQIKKLVKPSFCAVLMYTNQEINEFVFGTFQIKQQSNYCCRFSDATCGHPKHSQYTFEVPLQLICILQRVYFLQKKLN